MGEKKKPPVCPKCKSAKGVVPITYGYPPYELFEAEQRGELVLGGCVIEPNSPAWTCKTCLHRFGKVKVRE